MLPQEWEKRLVDVNVGRLTDRDLTWADYVFIGGMTVQRDSARKIISQCKTLGVKVVAGGPLFTIEHDQFEEVDHFVLNEAEVTLPEFLADLERGEPKRVYTSTEFADIQKTPVPMWELLDMDRYVEMAIQYSRGCPFNCDFCNVTALFGHRPRTKTAEQIIAELQGLYDLGWRAGVFFVDDNLIGNKRRLRTELLPALIEWGRNKRGISFNTEASMNLADDENLMEMMVEAGFNKVFVGIETPDEEGLLECSKKQNLHRDLVEDVKRLQRAGLEVQAGFIVGFDTDKPSIFQRQIDFIQKSGIVTAMVGLLQAPPGTRLYERMKNERRLLEDLSGDNVDGTTNIIPKMDFEMLREGYRSILRHIYSPDNYYRRVRTFLREYKLPKARHALDFEYVMAFFRSIVHIGILGKERMYYWRLLLWTLFRRPTLFPMAVVFSIYGFHFSKICERIEA